MEHEAAAAGHAAGAAAAGAFVVPGGGLSAAGKSLRSSSRGVGSSAATPAGRDHAAADAGSAIDFSSPDVARALQTLRPLGKALSRKASARADDAHPADGTVAIDGGAGGGGGASSAVRFAASALGKARGAHAAGRKDDDEDGPMKFRRRTDIPAELQRMTARFHGSDVSDDTSRAGSPRHDTASVSLDGEGGESGGSSRNVSALAGAAGGGGIPRKKVDAEAAENAALHLAAARGRRATVRAFVSMPLAPDAASGIAAAVARGPTPSTRAALTPSGVGRR